LEFGARSESHTLPRDAVHAVIPFAASAACNDLPTPGARVPL